MTLDIERQAAEPPPLLPDVKSSTYGVWRGAIQVDRLGQAQYSLPVELPAGRAGLTPELGFVYSTSSGDGTMGVGWTVGPLTSISRCRKTVRAQGYIRSVRHDGQDAYCLNGVVLHTIASPVPDTDWALSPENDPRIRVIGHMTGADRTSPSWDITSFEVHYPNGNRAFLGATSGSRYRSHTGRTASWYIERLVDPDGNSIQFNYAKNTGDPAIGQADSGILLRHIDYGGNSGATGAIVQSPIWRVTLEYENHAASTLTYGEGGSVWTKHRLREVTISTLSNGMVVAKVAAYKVTYEQSPHTERSRVRTLQRCAYLASGGASSESCLAPNSFEYSGGPATQGTLRSAPEAQIVPPAVAHISPHLFDIDGDGRSDLVYSRPTGPFNGVERHAIFFRRGLPASSPTLFGPELFYATLAGATLEGTFGDFDDNGSIDVVVRTPGADVDAWRLFLSPADRVFSPTIAQQPAATTEIDPFATSFDQWVDLDGDGLLDGLLCRGVSAVPDSDPSDDLSIYFVRWNNGSGQFGQPVPIATFDAQTGALDRAIACAPSSRPLVVDLDGDGALEIAYTGQRESGQGAVNFATFAGRTIRIESVTSEHDFARFQTFRHAATGDFNGDGLADFLWYDAAESGSLVQQVLANTGDPRTLFAREGDNLASRVPALTVLAAPNGDMGAPAPSIDLDGDGRADMFESSGSGFVVAYARNLFGDTLGPSVKYANETSLTTAADAGAPLFGDVDGNGMTDIVWPLAFGGFQVFQQTSERPDLLVAVHEGDPSVSSVGLTYGQLSDPAVYSRDPSCGVRSDTICVGGSQASVVRAVTLDAGPGFAPNMTVYSYANGRRERGASRWLGFERMAVTDIRTGAIDTTTFDLTTRTSNGRLTRLGQVVGRTTKTPLPDRWHIYEEARRHETLDVGTFNYLTYVRETTRAEYERSDADVCSGYECRALRSSTYSVDTIDAWGYPRQITENTSGEVSRTTILTYYPHDTAGWLMGRVHTEQVNETRLGSATEIRSRAWTYWPGQPRIHRLTVGELGDARQLVTTLDYDAYGNNVSTCAEDVVRHETRCTTIAYDPTRYHPVSVTNPLGHVTQTLMHPIFGVPQRLIDPNGEVHDTQFDSFGRVVLQRAPDGSTTRFAYKSVPERDGVVALLEREVSGSPTVTTAVDRLGRGIKTMWAAYDGLGIHIVQRAFDDGGRLSLVRGPYLDGGALPRPTLFTYDVLNRSTSKTLPNGGEVSWAYGPGLGAQDAARPTLGRTVTVTDPNGHARVTAIDGSGLVERVTDARQGTTTYRHGPFGVLLESTDALQRTTSWAYDRDGIRTQIADPITGLETFEVDAFGQIRVITQVETGSMVRLEYDPLGRRHHRDADGEITTWEYDVPGACVGQSDVMACAATHHTIGRLVRVVGPDATQPPPGPSTQASDESRYEYDTFGRLTRDTRRIEGRDYTYDFSYDSLGRVARMDYPIADDGWRFGVRYEYANGRLSQVLSAGDDATAFWTRLRTDEAGRTQEVALGNLLRTTWTYDVMGTIAGITTRDPSLTVPLSDMAFDHDLAGNVVGRRDLRQQMKEHFVYDELNRLTSNCFEAGTAPIPPPAPASPAATARLDEAPGASAGATVPPSGAAPPSAPDNTNLSKWSAYSQSPLTGPEDAAIVLSGAMPLADGSIFAADTEYRACTSYSYDALGNFEWREGVGAYEYPAATASGREIHAPSRVVHPRGATVIKYDDAGRTTQLGDNLYTYTALGWLRSARVLSGLSAQTGPLVTTFRYDGDGTRTKKASSVETVVYAGALFEQRESAPGSAPARLTFSANFREARAKIVADGAVIAELIHHVGALTVTAVDLMHAPWVETQGSAPLSAAALDRVANAALAGSTTAIYLHADPQGTIAMLTDAGKLSVAGRVIERRSYEPFGRLRSADWAAGQAPPALGRRNVGFTGHLEDEEAGLISMVGRVYSPTLGRFLTSDPFIQAALNTQSHNRYSYVWNNPVSMTDPTGFDAEGEAGNAQLPPDGSSSDVVLEYEFEDQVIQVQLPAQPGDATADTTASADGQVPPVDSDKPRRDSPFDERPRVTPRHAPKVLWDSYRELIRRAGAEVTSAGHRVGDAIHDVTGSDTLAALVATNVHIIGGIPVGLAGLGLLPEQLIDSLDVFDDGLQQLAVGLEQKNPYTTARAGAQLAGVVGMWSGSAAGAASLIKPVALAATTRRVGAGGGAGSARGGGGGGTRASRPLTTADLGVADDAVVEGTFGLRDGKATAYVKYLGAPTGGLGDGVLGARSALRNAARADGATRLRIETSPVIEETGRLAAILRRAGFAVRPNGTMYWEGGL